MCVCVCVCSDASNINGHTVASEASLSQFLLGEEYRREFLSLLQLLSCKQRRALKIASRFHTPYTQFYALTLGGRGGKVCFFIPDLLIIIQQLCGLFLFITAFKHLAKNDSPVLAQLSITTFLNGLIPVYHLANGYPWLC